MFPSLSPIGSGNLADFIRDALQNGGGIPGGSIGDFIHDALEQGGGIGSGNLGDIIGGLLGGGVHAMHPQFPLGRQ